MQQYLIAFLEHPIVAFIILLAIMVVVHELGHFIAAKACKVRVEAFSVGMGPRLFGIKYGETDYRVCAFPIGGYVKMTGENPDEESQTEAVNDPGAFTSHPRWQRMLIGVAGPLANFIFAILLMFGYYHFLNEVPPYVDKQITVDLVVPGTVAANAGIKNGDVIASFNGKQAPTFEEVNLTAATNQNQSVPVTILRNGQTIQTTLFVKGDPQKPEDFSFDTLGLIPVVQDALLEVDKVSAGKPAEQAGLKSGDKILLADGMQIHSVDALLAYLQAQAGKPLTLIVQRESAKMTLVVHPVEMEVPDHRGPWRIGFSPVPPPEHAKPVDWKTSWHRSIGFFSENSTMIFDVLGKVLTHRMSAKTLSGPIGMAQMAGEAARAEGYYPKFTLGAAISINLGILNLLPIPILDGGLILLLIIESIRRKDLNMMIKERIYQGAFVFLMVLFAFIIFNDLSKFTFFKGH